MINTPVNKWDIYDTSTDGLWYSMAKSSASAMVAEYATIVSGSLKGGIVTATVVSAGFDTTIEWLRDKGDGKNVTLKDFIHSYAQNIFIGLLTAGIDLSMDKAITMAYKYGGAVLKPFLSQPELVKWAKDGTVKASSGAIRSIYSQAGIKIAKGLVLENFN